MPTQPNEGGADEQGEYHEHRMQVDLRGHDARTDEDAVDLLHGDDHGERRAAPWPG